MEGLSVVVVVFVVLVFITIFLGVRIVPQGSKHVVQRLGKYHKTLGPGLNFIIPYIDTVATRLPPRTSCWTYPPRRSSPRTMR